jgi:hypothetical protein
LPPCGQAEPRNFRRCMGCVKVGISEIGWGYVERLVASEVTCGKSGCDVGRMTAMRAR